PRDISSRRDYARPPDARHQLKPTPRSPINQILRSHQAPARFGASPRLGDCRRVVAAADSIDRGLRSEQTDGVPELEPVGVELLERRGYLDTHTNAAQRSTASDHHEN